MTGNPIQAPAGGVECNFTGAFYEGGQFMPQHDKQPCGPSPAQIEAASKRAARIEAERGGSDFIQGLGKRARLNLRVQAVIVRATEFGPSYWTVCYVGHTYHVVCAKTTKRFAEVGDDIYVTAFIKEHRVSADGVKQTIINRVVKG